MLVLHICDTHRFPRRFYIHYLISSWKDKSRSPNQLTAENRPSKVKPTLMIHSHPKTNENGQERKGCFFREQSVSVQKKRKDRKGNAAEKSQRECIQEQGNYSESFSYQGAKVFLLFNRQYCILHYRPPILSSECILNTGIRKVMCPGSEAKWQHP